MIKNNFKKIYFLLFILVLFFLFIFSFSNSTFAADPKIVTKLKSAFETKEFSYGFILATDLILSAIKSLIN